MVDINRSQLVRSDLPTSSTPPVLIFEGVLSLFSLFLSLFQRLYMVGYIDYVRVTYENRTSLRGRVPLPRYICTSSWTSAEDSYHKAQTVSLRDSVGTPVLDTCQKANFPRRCVCKRYWTTWQPPLDVHHADPLEYVRALVECPGGWKPTWRRKVFKIALN